MKPATTQQYLGMKKTAIVSAIRKEFMVSSRKFAAIQRSAERVLLDSGRWKTLIRCTHCYQLSNRSEIQCNHIDPVGPLASTKPEDIGMYRERMFCPVGRLEACCIPCHRQHTQRQRKENEETEGATT